MLTPDHSLLTAALDGYEYQLAVMNQRIAAVRQALADEQPSSPTTKPTAVAKPSRGKTNRVMSAEGRARIAAAQQKRWRDARRRGVNPITGKRLPRTK